MSDSSTRELGVGLLSALAAYGTATWRWLAGGDAHAVCSEVGAMQFNDHDEAAALDEDVNESRTVAEALDHLAALTECTAARLRVRALLDQLTYRAFRVSAGMDATATRRELTALLGAAVGATVPEP